MSQIFNYSGNEEFTFGGSIYSNPKEAGAFLSLGIANHVDVFLPNKRARITAPFIPGVESLSQRKQVSLDVLPDECLYEIFRRLPGDQERSSCASVSKRWLMLLSSIPSEERCNKNDVAHDEAEEMESDGFLTRSLEGKKATDVRLAAIAVGSGARGGLGKLMIKGNNSVRGVSDVGLKAVARGCPSLKSLSIWNVASIGDEGIIEISKGCHRLEKLDLLNCPYITTKGLIEISKNCPSLTLLSIEGCQNIGDEFLQGIGQFCPNLKSVTIKDCPLIGDQGVAGLMSSASFALTKLKLQGLNVSDLALAVVGHYGKALTDIVLANLQNVNEKGFWVMGNAQGLHHLRSLTISSCRGMTDVAIEALGKGCPNLKHFILKKCAFLSDNGLISFTKASMSLESLQLEECHRITQIGFFGLLLSCGPKLNALTMSSCFGFKDMLLGLPLPNKSTPLRSVTATNCPGLGDMTLAMLAKLCPRLQSINLSKLPCITDAGLLSLIKSCDAGAGLVKVDLSSCVNVTDTVVLALAKLHGGTLEALNLEGCGKVTDASLVAIADNCLLLNELDLSKSAITDHGVASLARSKQLSLQVLSLSGCSMLSDKCLPYLAKIGQSLMGLNLQNCNLISSTVIDMLVDRLFRCDILF